MVDINAKLAIEIEVKDYEQVVRNDKGSLLGTMTKVPAVNSVIKGKVDRTIEEEVKNNLKQALPKKAEGPGGRQPPDKGKDEDPSPEGACLQRRAGAQGGHLRGGPSSVVI